MIHALSSETLRRERAHTRERASASLPSLLCDCEDPGSRAAPAAPLKNPFTSECLRPPQGALSEGLSIRQGAPMFQACRHSCKADSPAGEPPLMAREAHSPHRGGFVTQRAQRYSESTNTHQEKLFAQPLRTHRESARGGRPNSLRTHTKMLKDTHHSSPASDKGNHSVIKGSFHSPAARERLARALRSEALEDAQSTPYV
jgi:hypothetical protein